MTEHTSLYDILLEIVPAVILALFGGFAEMMLRSEKGGVSVKYICSSLVVSAFIGMVVCLLMYDKDISPAYQGAAAGVAGASARTLMDVIKTSGVKIMRRFLD
jgi:hypothetical protein